VGVAADGREAVELAVRAEPTLALVDIGLPDQSGLAVGRQILKVCPDVYLVGLTALDDHRLVEEAVRSGFRAYVMKDTDLETLVSSIDAVIRGEVVLPERGSRGNGVRSPAPDRETGLLVRQLTPREREVLGLLAEGAASKTIAARLGVSANTVRTHIQSILTKLQVHSRLEAAAFAIRSGVVDPVGSSDRT
jgi:two-component system, NarL family, nitrate/nitrite response regulator NarL